MKGLYMSMASTAVRAVFGDTLPSTNKSATEMLKPQLKIKWSITNIGSKAPRPKQLKQEVMKALPSNHAPMSCRSLWPCLQRPVLPTYHPLAPAEAMTCPGRPRLKPQWLTRVSEMVTFKKHEPFQTGRFTLPSHRASETFNPPRPWWSNIWKKTPFSMAKSFNLEPSTPYSSLFRVEAVGLSFEPHKVCPTWPWSAWTGNTCGIKQQKQGVYHPSSN